MNNESGRDRSLCKLLQLHHCLISFVLRRRHSDSFLPPEPDTLFIEFPERDKWIKEIFHSGSATRVPQKYMTHMLIYCTQSNRHIPVFGSKNLVTLLPTIDTDADPSFSSTRVCSFQHKTRCRQLLFQTWFISLLAKHSFVIQGIERENVSRNIRLTWGWFI